MHEQLPAHRAEARGRIDDRHLALRALFHELLAAYDTIDLILRHTTEIPAVPAEFIPLLHNLMFVVHVL